MLMKIKTIKRSLAVLVLMAISAGLSTPLQADIRKIKTISTPGSQGRPGTIDAKSLGVELEPITRADIENAARNFFKEWPTGNAGALISQEFPNKQRLLDTIIDTVPRDAQINVLGVRAIIKYPDKIKMLEDGSGFDRFSEATATVRTQIIFNDTNGRQVINGENDYTFEFREEYR